MTEPAKSDIHLFSAGQVLRVGQHSQDGYSTGQCLTSVAPSLNLICACQAGMTHAPDGNGMHVVHSLGDVSTTVRARDMEDVTVRPHLIYYAAIGIKYAAMVDTVGPRHPLLLRTAWDKNS